jgi:protein TonB
VARAAAIDGGGWTGAGLAPGAGGARLQATPRLDREASSAPARSGLAFAALASLAVHAAIVAAAMLSLGAPRPTGEPDAIAVEWIAASGETAAAPATDADLARATRPPRDDAAPADAAQSAPPPDAATPAKAPDPAAPAAPEAADAASVTAPAPPTPPEQAAAAGGVPAAPSPPQTIATPPEAEFVAAAAPPRPEAKSRAAPAPPRATARLNPSSTATGARAASAPAPAPARGVAALADYRNALLAKISGAVRYPEAARERGETGVATVRFALDGVGAVTLADLAKSSGDRALDDEALAAVRRASPLPAPPAGAPRAYSAPIRFELR